MSETARQPPCHVKEPLHYTNGREYFCTAPRCSSRLRGRPLSPCAADFPHGSVSGLCENTNFIFNLGLQETMWHPQCCVKEALGSLHITFRGMNIAELFWFCPMNFRNRIWKQKKFYTCLSICKYLNIDFFFFIWKVSWK